MKQPASRPLGRLACVSGLRPMPQHDEQNPALLRIGNRGTRLPQLGAAQQPWVAVEQLPAGDGV